MRDVKKDNLKSTLCYIPLVAIGMYFLEEDKSERLKKHINYWIILFVWLVIINIVLNAIFLGFFTLFTTLWYIWISVFLWFKVYNWEAIDVEILDNIEKKVKNKIDKNEEQIVKKNKKNDDIEDILKNSNF